MRALEQFSKFCANVVERFATPHPQSAHDHDERTANDGHTQTSDDEKHARPPYGSHPAVWPR